MLSCGCFDDGEWYYIPPEDFTVLNTTRRKRCCSCGKLIDWETPCLQFTRIRDPCNDIEERIWGDEVQMADWYMCEWCGEMFLNLEALGYCHQLGGRIDDDLHDYWDLTGFEPKLEPKGATNPYR